MKGIVFTELIEMVEQDLGLEIADRMITKAQTANDGAYTTVGTYDHAELIKLVIALSEETQIPVADLVQTFGKHLFARFHVLYPQFFEGVESAIDFLPRVESYIHVEVRKLYPDAELPSFTCSPQPEGGLQMTYRSRRPFADLAEGLIRACVAHFGDPIHITRTDFGSVPGTNAKFLLQPVASFANA